MAHPHDGQEASGSLPEPDEDVYAIREPEEPPAERMMRPLARRVELEPPEEAEQPFSPPPVLILSFVYGVFAFPWYPQTVAAWGLVSIGATLTAEGVVFCFWLADIGMGMAVRAFGPAVLLVGTFCLSYTSACFSTIIEQTAEGGERIEQWPSGLWRDWFWTMPFTLGMLLPPLVVVAILARLAGVESDWPYAVAAWLAYPVLLLSALESGSPLAPASAVVLRSLRSVWWGWAVVYAVSAAMGLAWYGAVRETFPYRPFAATLLAAPAATAALFIYARLLGRLMWCAGQRELDGDDE